ncbi:hypothetical protein OOU_Y34scaffold01152g5 [Pyricularia oryzae Y34]|uniref:Uncharacterized protein n=1 Tax=Pyricularia oryzae (strain Y34) TaxID=1143189 RepID=A0AA97NLR3_PYRO3|nr:hypothetical protein OOU_Y34scaffold01152g5 [Pyricularia oryzae Y34]
MIRTNFKLPNRKLSRMDFSPVSIRALCVSASVLAVFNITKIYTGREVVGPWRLHREGREVVGPWRLHREVHGRG